MTHPISSCSIFYKMVDELWAEVEDLMDRGISGSGSGFEGPSAGRLGSHGFIPMHNPPEHKAREIALKVSVWACKMLFVEEGGDEEA